MTILAVLTLLLYRAWRPAAFLAVTVPLGALLVSLGKLAIDRARPMILPQFDHVRNASMPSGHAANGTIVWLGCALALATLWPHRRRPLVAVALAIAFLIGLSRLVLGVHWPSDVVVGWALGLGWTLLCARVAGLERSA